MAMTSDSYIFNPAPGDCVVINRRLVLASLVDYYYTSAWDDGEIHERPADYFPVWASAAVGGTEVGRAFTADGAHKILGFVKR